MLTKKYVDPLRRKGGGRKGAVASAAAAVQAYADMEGEGAAAVYSVNAVPGVPSDIMDVLCRSAVIGCLHVYHANKLARHESWTPLVGTAGTVLRCNPYSGHVGACAYVQEMLQARCGMQLQTRIVTTTSLGALRDAFDVYQKLRGNAEYLASRLTLMPSDIVRAAEILQRVCGDSQGLPTPRRVDEEDDDAPVCSIAVCRRNWYKEDAAAAP